MDIMQVIKASISKELHIPIENISDTAHLQNDLFADSLDMLMIRLEIEKILGFTFNQDELVDLISIDAIYEMVLRKMRC